MTENNEMIRQKIIVELEHARLCERFLLPLATLCLTLAFTNSFLDDLLWIRLSLAGVIVLAILIVFLERKRRINNVYQYIQQLKD